MTIHTDTTKIQYKNTIRRYNTKIPYKDTIQRYNTKIQYKDTIQKYKQKYNTKIQYKDTIQKYNTKIQCKDTIQRYNTIALVSTIPQLALLMVDHVSADGVVDSTGIIYIVHVGDRLHGSYCVYVRMCTIVTSSAPDQLVSLCCMLCAPQRQVTMDTLGVNGWMDVYRKRHAPHNSNIH